MSLRVILSPEGLRRKNDIRQKREDSEAFPQRFSPFTKPVSQWGRLVVERLTSHMPEANRTVNQTWHDGKESKHRQQHRSAQALVPELHGQCHYDQTKKAHKT